MSLLNKITRGRLVRPLRITLYGVEGVGKSTFGAAAPRPVFLCAEDGTSRLDVERLPQPKAWLDVIALVAALTTEEHPYHTLVVDTLDWLEPLCWAHVCQKSGKGDIEAFGYGKGYVAALDEWRVLLARLETLQAKRGTHVVLLAHAAARPHKDPAVDAEYKKWQLKLHTSAAGLISEWSDAVLFATHESYATKSDGKVRGVSTGERVLHTQWTAAYHAKNRFGLPETLPLDWAGFAEHALAPAPLASAAEQLAELELLLPKLPTDRRELAQQAIAAAGEDPLKLAPILGKARKLATATTTETVQ